jgi:hypothetical protein
MIEEVHLSPTELVAYALGLPSNADLEQVELHLVICEVCQEELTLAVRYLRAKEKVGAPSGTAGRLRSLHFTMDGPIIGAMHSDGDGKWIARQWGRELDGARICDSVKEAHAYLMESFWQMFPEHVCLKRCLQLPTTAVTKESTK